MQVKNFSLQMIIAFSLLCAGCNSSDTSKPDTIQKTDNTETKKTEPVNSGDEVKAPEFTDPALRQYYSEYTTYINKLVAAIQNNDEAATMKLFNEEGVKYKDKQSMDKKATAADEPTFTTWLLSSISAQKIIVQSEYYKKFNEEYNKKVQEKFKEKGY